MLSSCTLLTATSGAITTSPDPHTNVDLFFFVIPIMLLSMCLILVLILMVLGFKGLEIFPSFIEKESAIIVLVKSPMVNPLIA